MFSSSKGHFCPVPGCFSWVGIATRVRLSADVHPKRYRDVEDGEPTVCPQCSQFLSRLCAAYEVPTRARALQRLIRDNRRRVPRWLEDEVRRAAAWAWRRRISSSTTRRAA